VVVSDRTSMKGARVDGTTTSVSGKKFGKGGVKTYYCLWQAVGNDLIFEVKVTDPKNYQRDIGQEKHEVKTWVFNSGGRQENSLRTVRSILQVLYTNTGWSVCTCLGQAYILKQVAYTLGQVQIQIAGEQLYCAPRSGDLFIDLLIC